MTVDNLCTWQGKTIFDIHARRSKNGELFAPINLKFRHKRLTVISFGVIAAALDGIGKDTNLSIVGNIADRKCRKCKQQHPNIIITSFSLDKGKTWIDEASLSGVKSLTVEEYRKCIARENGRTPDDLPPAEFDFFNNQPF